MGVVQLREIQNQLTQNFTPYIDTSDYAGKPNDERQKAELTRAIAAFALSSEADIDPPVACGCVTDGFDDNGLDAIYFSPSDQVLYVVQSKWSMDGSGSIDLGAVHKFTQGLSDLLDLKFDRFNEKVTRRQRELEVDITNASRVVMIIAYSGNGGIGDHPRRHLDDYFYQMNDTG